MDDTSVCVSRIKLTYLLYPGLIRILLEGILDYYFLDAVSWGYSQALYHAAAYLGREALFILRPSTPYVCIGFHQDANQEIDLEFTTRNKIPVFRRDVGGGAVYLDGKQLFFQLVVKQNHRGVPLIIADFYREFLQPVIETYRHFGIPAEYKPVNDIIANGRKISGTGAAQIDNMLILVGNFIQDFDYEIMAKCLRVPDEKFRDKVFKTMQENLTTILRETGGIPSNNDLADELSKRYSKILGKLTPKLLDTELIKKADQLLTKMNNPEWLMANDRRHPDLKQVKVSDGVFVIQKIHKTPGGIIRITAVNQRGRLKNVHISGDFFFFPARKIYDLEQKLENVLAEEKRIDEIVKDFYQNQGIESPGVVPSDFSKIIIN
ncbi:MAG TPA: hypothetical protein DEG92_01990 [Rikenellaceae bacterium]|nr:hypothetical protein [Rikenellaceae bacterium]